MDKSPWSAYQVLSAQLWGCCLLSNLRSPSHWKNLKSPVLSCGVFGDGRQLQEIILIPGRWSMTAQKKTHKYTHLIFLKSAKAIQWRDSLFGKHCWTSIGQKWTLTQVSYLIQKTNKQKNLKINCRLKIENVNYTSFSKKQDKIFRVYG